MLFSARQPALSLPQISSALNIPESTAYRLLTTLQKKHVIARDSKSRKFILDASLLRLHAVISANLSINRLALSHLEDLADRSNETAHLHLLQDDQMVLVEAVKSRHSLRFDLEVGTTMPLHAPAGGRAMLAFLPDRVVDEYLHLHTTQFTPHTLVNVLELRRELAEVRCRGFALTVQQYMQGTVGIAAPVFDHRSEPVASIAVVGPTTRFTEQDALNLVPSLLKHSAELSAEMGCPAREERRTLQRSSPL